MTQQNEGARPEDSQPENKPRATDSDSQEAKKSRHKDDDTAIVRGQRNDDEDRFDLDSLEGKIHRAEGEEDDQRKDDV